MEPKIIFEDDSIIVIDKPSRMIVYPAGKHQEHSVQEWLSKRYKEFYFVHRLDRETSGVMVIARTKKVADILKQQFKDRETKKVYRAFVYGNFKDERGIIDKPIGSARGGLAPRSATRPYGTMREARTSYRRITNGEGAAYVEAFPETGRTHQIRVHFAALQHPIVGDSQYAPGRTAMLGFSRLALHACSLSFKDPKTGVERRFEAPVPSDFKKAEELLRTQ